MQRSYKRNIGLVPLTLLLSITAAFGTVAVVFGNDGASEAKSLGDLSGPWQLFIDDSLVAEKSNLQRTYHAFEKYGDNPLLVADQPWEGDIAYVYGTILPAEDKASGYRMWYHSYNATDKYYRHLYATSIDGINWEKPGLGQVNYNGSTDNNIIYQRTSEQHLPQVIHTPWETDPAKRYKLIDYDYGRTPPNYTTSGFYGAFSPDGIHWTGTSSPPSTILDDPGDVGNFVWDPHAARYLGYPKIFTQVGDYNRRCAGISSTKNFEQWPQTRLLLAPDEIDDQWTDGNINNTRTEFYGLSGFAYESGYIGFLWIFHITDGLNDGPIWCEVVSSCDGENWIRQEPGSNGRMPILALGPDGSWDDAMVFTPNHPLVEGDRIKLYYGGFDTTHGKIESNAAIGLATLRKDGFASLDAGEQTGQVTTKPLADAAGAVRVNCNAAGGWVKAAVLDSAGKIIPGYGIDDCDAVRADGVDLAITWGPRNKLPVAAGPLRLRFELQNASIYSFAAGDTLIRSVKQPERRDE